MRIGILRSCIMLAFFSIYCIKKKGIKSLQIYRVVERYLHILIRSPFWTSKKRKMKLRIAPPVLTLLSAVLMWAIANYLTFAAVDIELSWRKSIFMVFVILGSSAASAAFVNFQSSNTSIDPMKPEKASVLVTEGIFQFSRNPMYLGLLSCLIGWAIYLNNPLTLLVVLGFFFYMTRVQIKAEEEALNEKFGETYQAYMKEVRRWL